MVAPFPESSGYFAIPLDRGSIRIHMVLRAPSGLVTLVCLVCLAACSATPHTAAYRTTTLSEDRKMRAQQANEDGVAWASQRQFDRAEASFQAALTDDPTLASAHNNLGLVLIERHDYYRAALEFTMAVRLAPNAVEPHVNLGQLYDAVEWPREAQKAYREALRIAPDHGQAIGLLARSLVTHGQLPEAFPLLTQIAQRSEVSSDQEWTSWARQQLREHEYVAEPDSQKTGH